MYGQRANRIGGWIAVLALGVVACTFTHDPRPVSMHRVAIWDRGISIPVPPPSIIQADVEGDVEGDDVVEGTAVVLEEKVGEQTGEDVLEAGLQTFKFEAVEFRFESGQLVENCFEVWVEEPDGAQSERTQYTAVFDETAGELSFVEGC